MLYSFLLSSLALTVKAHHIQPCCYKTTEKYVFMLFQVQESIDPPPESNWPTPLQKRRMVGVAPRSLCSSFWEDETRAHVPIRNQHQTLLSSCLRIQLLDCSAASLWNLGHRVWIALGALEPRGPITGAPQEPPALLPSLPLLMLPLPRHHLEQSGNPNCWLKINPLVLAKAQTSKVLPFDSREWTYSVLCQTEPWISIVVINMCLPNASVCLN